MICYLIRHGKDDDTLRGGWSNTPLSEEGIQQVAVLAEALARNATWNVANIYTSDLTRARQTADIIADRLHVPVTCLPQFREANNGKLAGMKNTEAIEKYPGLFWNTLAWDERYPDGESPHEFFERVSKAWHEFAENVRKSGDNVILVTHGGVINVILHMINGLEYSNQTKPFSVKNAEVISVEL